MFKLKIAALAVVAFSTAAQAQWVTSGSGMGSRTGDQGLTNADGASQSLGYEDNAALEAASIMGYEANSEDGALWTAATSGTYDEDCRILFGADCDEVSDDTFRPQQPITEEALDNGFTGVIEQDAYLLVCGGLPDAQRCKQKGYEATQGDASLCQMSVTDTDNLAFCQARPGNASGDCSDLPREDYEDIVTNNAPEIILPADWTPPSLSTSDSPQSEIFQFSAVDADNDPLTWSVRDSNGVFEINGQGMLSLATALSMAGQNLHSAEVKVSDGIAFDIETVRFDVTRQNRPPQIIVPADWQPSEIASTARPGDELISRLGATDPDGDELTWSITSMDFDLFQIDPQSAVVSLFEGNNIPEQSPDSVTLTVQVSDGELTDELTLKLDVEDTNRPPQIIVPESFAAEALEPYAAQNTQVGALEGQDPDGDALTWKLLDASPQIFAINAATGAISYNGLGNFDKLACEARAGGATKRTGSSQTGSASSRSQGGYPRGIVSVNGNFVQDHGAVDFRSKRVGGSFSTSGKYHVVLERANHRGGSFTTESRAAMTYAYEGGSIFVPALSATSVNSNLSPINSYLVFQNNSQLDFRGTNGRVTFENPIVGLYYTDGGFDNTITSLGKPGAQYSRKFQQSKLGLENGKDIAWIDPVDRRVLNFRSRTANIGDFIRVITTASKTTDNGSGNTEPVGPDSCSATLTVQLSDGEATDEETLTLAFGDPNRAPQVFTPADWTPSTVSNAKDVGDLVINTLGATDPDGDVLKWSLEGADANLFSITSFDGKISLSPAYGNTSSLPSKANVTVKVTDGRLSDSLAITIPIEEKLEKGSMASNAGTSGSFQFVSDTVQNIFNQDYTIMARFYHGSGGYRTSYKGKKSDDKETIFFYGGNNHCCKAQSGVSLHVVKDTIRLQLGSDYNYLETRASIQQNRWHTVMFVVDADSRRKAKKDSWPVKMYLNGSLLGVNEFKTSSMFSDKKNKEYAAVANAKFAALGVAGKWRQQSDHRRPYGRHLPLRASSFIHEVSIWQGNKSNVAAAIYNNNGDVADYASTAVGKPRYSWKPALWGQSMTDDGKGTLTLGNLANGKAENGGPRAGIGTKGSRLDGDMHLYPGRFESWRYTGWLSHYFGDARPYTQWQGGSPYVAWHQGDGGGEGFYGENYFQLLNTNAGRNWLPTYDKNDAGDVKAFTTGEMNGQLKTLN